MTSISAVLLVLCCWQTSAATNHNLIDELDRISIGLPYEEIVRIRPNVKPTEIAPESEAPSPAVRMKGQMVADEHLLSSPLFSDALYFFTDGRLQGLRIGPGEQTGGKKILESRNGLLKSLYARFGKPSELAVLQDNVGRAGTLEAPTIIWQRADGLIILVLPTATMGRYAAMEFTLNLLSKDNAGQFLKGRRPVSESEAETFFGKAGLRLPKT